MNLKPIVPPRVFRVGADREIVIQDCARIHLDAGEQITMVAGGGAEWDILRKEWGFYATPSLNGRLSASGFRSALAQGSEGKTFLFLVEAGKEAEFRAYLDSENHRILAWLHDEGDLAAWIGRLRAGGGLTSPDGAQTPKATLRCPCDGSHCRTRFEYREPPPGEVRFDLGGPEAYRRELRECGICGHFYSDHAIPMDRLYSGGYVDANYGTRGIGEQFARINALDPARSDNVGRVERVHAFATAWLDGTGSPAASRTVLDVGSGLCVFLHRMKQRGWNCTALDPDPRTAEHARRTVGISAHCGDFFAAADLGRFNLVTFNKVLEHVTDPVAMLAKSREHLLAGGLVYIELPDGEAAARAGKEREEFFIDHWHAFSPVSIAMLAERSGFDILLSERLVEPSGKYTLRAFLKPAGA